MSEFIGASGDKNIRVEELLGLAEDAEVGFPVGYSVAATTDGFPQESGIVLGMPASKDERTWKFVPESRVQEVLEVAKEFRRHYRTPAEASSNRGPHDFVHLRINSTNHDMALVIWESMLSLKGAHPNINQTRRPFANAIRNLSREESPHLYKEGNRMAAAYEHQILAAARGTG